MASTTRQHYICLQMTVPVENPAQVFNFLFGKILLNRFNISVTSYFLVSGYGSCQMKNIGIVPVTVTQKFALNGFRFWLRFESLLAMQV